ncbi:uncharacterized protein LOC126969598 [Leptidea sinapis]|uniref:uncharacterized protein LOC126969598 n=1 Tax=Leptidea sinapis TaxID=189913 RepID=UPI00213AAFD8|nr:uncharacterized protein LOC126969598 [Leptidea sinapis]
MKELAVFIVLVVYCVGPPIETVKRSRHIDFWNRYQDKVMDVTDFSVYYDLNTNETIRRMMPRPWYKPGWLLRLPFSGGPCECKQMQCTCCTGIRIQTLNYDRRTCTVLSYEPEDSIFNMDVKVNNATVFQNTYSARNPPPFCVPVPVPYLPPGLVDMCVRLFDVSVVDGKFHICMDMDTRVDKAPVLILHFDCMDMGAGGVGLSKPGGSNNQTDSTTTTAVEPTQVNSDVYDPVFEDKNITANPIFKNSIKYI